MIERKHPWRSNHEGMENEEKKMAFAKALCSDTRSAAAKLGWVR